ncbi:hypothetical protein ACXYMT_13390 [Salinimicrobium sp. CAU 1759]
MKILALIFTATLTITASIANAQDSETDIEAQKAISQLEFIVGDWKGTGWMMGRDGQKHPFNQTENIKFKLDSTAILIEGLGKSNEIITHNAMAIVTYDKSEKNYNFRSYLSTGRGGDFKAELIDGKFYWYPNENMRYIISLNNKGQWYETGEIKRDNEWVQFFEMTLDKQ